MRVPVRQIRLKGRLQIERLSLRKLALGIELRVVELDDQEAPVWEILLAFPTLRPVRPDNKTGLGRVGYRFLHPASNRVEPLSQLADVMNILFGTITNERLGQEERRQNVLWLACLFR